MISSSIANNKQQAVGLAASNFNEAEGSQPSLNIIAALENQLEVPRRNSKPKRNSSKSGGKGERRGSVLRTKKIKSISPSGKTLSTEDTNGLSPGIEHQRSNGGTHGSQHQSSNSNHNSTANGSGGAAVAPQVIKTISTKKSANSGAKKEKSHKVALARKRKLSREASTFVLPQEKNQNNLSLLGKRFKIEDEMLGFGSFGRTYLGKDIKRQKSVAIKIMIRKKSEDSFYREATVLKSVNYLKHSGFPQMLMSAMNEDICILVEELLGMNLESLRKKFGKLCLPVVCSIGIQLINRLQSMHQCGFIHRDIKPQNILLGGDQPEKSNKIYLIDFGLSIPFIDPQTDQHYKQNPNHNYSNVVGTALFASINAHMGKDLSRRDDIESLIYTLIYLGTGSLPWKNINIKKKRERHQIIMYMKEEISQNQQFQQNMAEVPAEFFNMLAHSQKLTFEQEPDYKYLKSQLQKILKRSFQIKKMSEIDLINNNGEDYRNSTLKQFSNKTTQDSSMIFNNQLEAQIQQPASINPQEMSEKQKQLSDIIDINAIAYNFGLDKMMQDGGSDVLNSVQSNEQLAFRSEIDGRSNQEDFNAKLNPSTFKQLFASQSIEDMARGSTFLNGALINPNGRYITEIPEVEDDDSYGEEDHGGRDDDDEDDEAAEDEDESHNEESKSNSLNHTNTNKSKKSEKSKSSFYRKSLKDKEESKIEEFCVEGGDGEEEYRNYISGGARERAYSGSSSIQDVKYDGLQRDEEDDEGDNYGCEEEIPDDLEVCAQISGYFLNAKDNDLKDIKGGLNSINVGRLEGRQRSL